MVSFSIIVAIDKKNGIGLDGKLPWHIPRDLIHFKKITTQTRDKKKQNAVIMGRKTWDSIPENFRPLTGRLNIVISGNQSLRFPEGVVRVKNFERSFKIKPLNIESFFVIGGSQVFNEAIKSPLCKKIYLTVIDNDFSCDTFFPDFRSDYSIIKKTSRFQEIHNGKKLTFYFSELKRNKSQLS